MTSGSHGGLLAGRRLQRAQPATVRPAASVAIAIVLLGLGLFAIRVAAVEFLINTADTPGGRAVIVQNPTARLLVNPPGVADGAESVLPLYIADPSVLIGTCSQLATLLGGPQTDCRDSGSYRVKYPGVDPPPITESSFELSAVDERTGEAIVRRVPMPTETVQMPLPGGDLGFIVDFVVPEELITPALAVDPNRLIVIHDGSAGREETIRRHIYATAPTADIASSRQSITRGLDQTRGFTQLVAGIALIVAIALLLAVAIQTIDGVDQRRRDTSALILAGTPRRMLRRVEAAVAMAPVILAVASSFAVSLLSDIARSRVVGAPLELDAYAYLFVGAASGVGIGLIGWLATLGIPNEPSADSLRYE